MFDSRKTKTIQLIFLVAFLVSVLWYTVLKRHIGFHAPRMELFWSYKLWFSGDWDYGKEILGNIAMFIPFGFLLACLTEKRKGTFFLVLGSAALFSLAIEGLQLFLLRGLFEWDDVFNNTVGAGIGFGICKCIAALLPEKKRAVVTFSIVLAAAFVCAGLAVSGRGETGEEAEASAKDFCFQIDDVRLDGGMLTLTGFAFRYKKDADSIRLLLKSLDTGKTIPLTVQYGLEREDVDRYFLCDHDYTNVGFQASGTVDETEEYEILVRFPWFIAIPTGVYLTGDRVHYAKDSEFLEPEGLEAITENGILRVYRPDRHCWVYQLGSSLYWIANRDFYFESDGTTYIQYQLWTTQTQNLPEKRLKNGHLWDNIGGCFETYELEGNFGKYRVMKREIPAEYSVTAIVTGYYRSGAWVWKDYFRPIYLF